MKQLFRRAMQAARRLIGAFHRAPFQPSRFDDPKVFLREVINDKEEDPTLRVIAAKELMALMHEKHGAVEPRKEVK